MCADVCCIHAVFVPHWDQRSARLCSFQGHVVLGERKPFDSRHCCTPINKIQHALVFAISFSVACNSEQHAIYTGFWALLKTDICSVLSNMHSKHIVISGSFFHSITSSLLRSQKTNKLVFSVLRQSKFSNKILF